MNRQTRNTWILIAVVGFLGAGALAEQVRDRQLAPKPMMRIEPREVHEIARTCQGCTALQILKRQGAWELTRPYIAVADAERVQRLVDIAAAPMRHRYQATALELDKVGLAPPFATLQLGARTLEFGATEAISQDRYVRFGGTVALVQDRFTQILTATPESFVDPRLLAGLAEPVSGQFLGQPLDPKALKGLFELKAARIDPPPKTIAAHKFALNLKDGKVVELLFEIDGEEWRILRRGGGPLYIVMAETMAGLGVGAH